MKKTILLFATLLSTVCANAQQMNLSWAKSFVAPNAFGYAQAYNNNITPLSNGDLIVVGTFKDTIDFDPAAATTAMLSSPTDYNVHITRLNSNGDFVWTKMLDGDNEVFISNLQTDANGNYYMNGFFKGTCDFNPDPLVANNLTSSGDKDVFLCKWNSTGVFQWVRQFGNAGSNISYDMATDAAGTCYMAVMYVDSIDADPGVAQSYYLSNGLQDALMVKVSTSGTLLNAYSIGGAFVDVIRDFKVLPGNELLVTGSVLGTVDLDPGVGTFPVTVLPGTQAGFILKLNAQGAFTWAKVLQPQNGGSLSRVESIDTDQNGNIYLSGVNQGAVDFNPDNQAVHLISSVNGTMDAYMMKLNSAGQFLWAHSFGANFSDYLNSVTVMNDGRCFIFGEYSGQIDLDPDSVNTMLITSPGSFGNYQNFILGLDANGNYSWGSGVGGYGANLIGNTLVTDGNNNLFSCGYYGGSTDFDPNAGVFNLSSPPLTGGGFILKLSTAVTGVSESTASDFNFFPNPATDQVIIQSSSGDRMDNIAVFALSGKCISSIAANQHTAFRLDVSSLSAGMYLLQITSSAGITAKKLQVVK
jgi:hypothetical protein